MKIKLKKILKIWKNKMVLSTSDCLDRKECELQALKHNFERKKMLLEQEYQHGKSKLEQEWEFKAEQASIREQKKIKEREDKLQN